MTCIIGSSPDFSKLGFVFKKIMVALDGHPASLSALTPAQALAAAFAAEVRLVSVEWPRSPRGKEWKLNQSAYLDKKNRELKDYLESWAGQLRQQGLQVTVSVLPLGGPVLRLLDEIESWGADLLILSTHAREGLSRWLLGSVAEEMNRRARCPLLIVRPARAVQRKSPDEGFRAASTAEGSPGGGRLPTCSPRFLDV